MLIKKEKSTRNFFVTLNGYRYATIKKENHFQASLYAMLLFPGAVDGVWDVKDWQELIEMDKHYKNYKPLCTKDLQVFIGRLKKREDNYEV